MVGRQRALVLNALLIIAMFGASLVAYPLEGTVSAVPPVLNLYLAQRPVAIDGSASGTEWTDALEVKLLPWKGNASYASGEAYWFAKHDGQFMYALFDFVSERAFRANEWGQLQWDKSHEAAPVPQLHDWVLLIEWKGPGQPTANSLEVGSGTGPGRYQLAPVPESIQTAAGISASSKSATPHVVIEMKIALSDLGPGDSNGIWGFAAAAIGGWDGRAEYAAMDLEYPADNDNNPNSWGELKQVEVPIPEFPLAALILGAAIIGVLVIAKRQRGPRGTHIANTL